MTHSKFRGTARRPRLIGALALVAALTATAAGCASEGGANDGASEGGAATHELFSQDLHDQLPERVQSAGSIVIGGTFDNPPVLFASEADATKPAGIAYDLSLAVGNVLGVDVNWENTQWAGQLPGLDGGKLDLAWGQATVTEEREESLYDMIPYYLAPMGVLVQEGNPESITSFESMCGQVIGGAIGAIQEQYIELSNDKYCTDQGDGPITYKAYMQGEEVALSSGAINGVVDTYPVLVSAEENLDGVEAIQLSDSEEFTTGLSGITVSKKNPELSKAFAAALQKLHKAGIYQDILAAHGVADATLGEEKLVVNFVTGTPAGEVK